MNSFQEMWRRTSLIQRLMLVSILIGCLGAAGFLAHWASRPTYSLLYSGLAPEEASRIVEKVRDESIPYKLKEGGTSIYVATGEVYQLRLKMASAGLPQGEHVGYRIIDQEKIGTSPFMQKVNHIRAIEGELAKTIETMDAVSAARVKVVPTESSLFGGGGEQSATASVAVRLKRGRRMTGQNVAAIVHLMAGGVQGLSPSNVTVVDTEGNLLSNDGSDPLAKGVRGVLDHKVQAEDYLARKVEDMLTSVIGPGRAKAEVAVMLDTTSLEEMVETPTEGVATREITKTKTSSSGGGGEKSAPGTNLKDSTSETEYIPGRTVRKTVKLPGEITKVSVSCFVDLYPKASKEEGEDAAAASTENADLIMPVEDVKTMICNALGLSGDAAENVKVVNTRFHGEAAPTDVAVMDQGLMSPSFLLEVARRASLGILVIGGLLVLRMLRKGSKKSDASVEGEVAQSENLLTAAAASGNREALRSQISRALQDNPDEVKRLFLSWVENDKEGK